MVEFHREGSAPAACAAGFFIFMIALIALIAFITLTALIALIVLIATIFFLLQFFSGLYCKVGQVGGP